MAIPPKKASPRVRGFTLIEILVSLTLIAVGLLGLAQLILKGQQASFEAYQRQQAISLANDMLEKIKTNRARAADYAAAAPVATPLGEGNRFNDLTTGTITDCAEAAATCTPDVLAIYDVAYWDGLLQGSTETFNGGANRAGGATNASGVASRDLTANVTIAMPGGRSPSRRGRGVAAAGYSSSSMTNCSPRAGLNPPARVCGHCSHPACGPGSAARVWSRRRPTGPARRGVCHADTPRSST
jgi:type IV pilus assembly protein PilV